MEKKNKLFLIILASLFIISLVSAQVGIGSVGSRANAVIIPGPNLTIIDTNATTACSGAQVLLGNGSCGTTGAGGGGDFSFTDFQSSYGLNLTNIFDQDLNTTDSPLFRNLTILGNLTIDTFNIRVNSGGNLEFINSSGSEIFILRNSIGTAEHVNGTKNNPAITFISDVDSGIFSPGNNILGFSAGTVEFLRFIESVIATDEVVFNNDGLDIDFRIKSSDSDDMFFINGSSNRVGINTSTPEQLFQVNGGNILVNTSIAGRVVGIGLDANLDWGIQFSGIGGNMDRVLMRQKTTNDIFIGDIDDNNGDVFFRAGGITVMTLKDGGNVGIGTTSPQQLLNVDGSFNVTGGINLSSYLSCTALETDANGNLLCGSVTGNPFNQVLNTTSNVNFSTLNLSGNLIVNGGDIGTIADPDVMQLLVNEVDFNGDIFVVGSIFGNDIQADPWIGSGSNEISNALEADILFQGVGGADNTDITFDLDGVRPRIFSATDNTIEIAEAVIIIGTLDVRGGVIEDTDSEDLIIRTNSVANQLVLDLGGNVGIGTSSPSANLEVKGTLATLFSLLNSVSNDGEAWRLSYAAINNAGTQINYVELFTAIDDNSTGSEDGQFRIRTMRAGTIRNMLNIGSSNIVINEDGQDTNLRVESVSNVNMLFVDAGNNRVGIGRGSPSRTLTVAGDLLIESNPVSIRFNNTGGGINNKMGMIRIDDGIWSFVFQSDAQVGSGEGMIMRRDPSGNGNRIGSFEIGPVGGAFFIVNQTNERVGIGTSNPLSKLEIAGTGIVKVRINSNNGNEAQLDFISGATFKRLFYRDSDGDFGIWNGSLTQFRIDGSDGHFELLGGNVGIGTTTPTHLLNVVGDTNISIDLIVGQHYISKGLTPSITTCGTSPSITGTDMAGRVTLGTGVVVSCTINFATAYANTPVCLAISNDNSYRISVSSISTTAFTISAAGVASSDVWSYHCIGL